MPVVYTGTVELDLDGGDVAGTVELDHVVLGTAESYTSFGDIESTPEVESCSVGVLDTILSILGYDVISFIDADFDSAAQELGDAIERDLITYDIPMACSVEDDEPEPEPSDCEDGYVRDCDDECTLESWIGDGYCEDGTTSWGGNFDCFEFDYDGGDCS